MLCRHNQNLYKNKYTSFLNLRILEKFIWIWGHSIYKCSLFTPFYYTSFGIHYLLQYAYCVCDNIIFILKFICKIHVLVTCLTPKATYFINIQNFIQICFSKYNFQFCIIKYAIHFLCRWH